jgi:long-chain acyl-CoA synthetase
MLTTVAKQNARRTAIVDGSRIVSYAVLEKRINFLASKLHNIGVCQGDRVAILLPNSLEFVTNYFATMAVGAIVVPMNDHYQQTELLYFLEECGVSLIITSKDYADLCHQVLSIRKSPCKLFFVEDHIETSEVELISLDSFKVEMAPDSPVMYQFSSGSTGRPKQIARTHANLLFELDS